MVAHGDSSGHDEIQELLNQAVPFASVQEILKSNPSTVPKKYLRKEEDTAKVYAPSDEIPILDLSLLSTGDEEELKKFDMACKDWGFFQVINHGIDEELLESVKEGASGFFNLPLEEKMKYPVDRAARQGYGPAILVAENQTTNWSDSFLFRIQPVQLRKPELWPTKPPGFKESVETCSTEVKRVAEELIRCLSLIMKMEKDALLGLHKELWQSLRVNYYPPFCNPDKVNAMGAHSDPGTVTILFQNNDVVGLQIWHGDGWVPIKPIPNGLVVNVGDVVEILSNGKYKSVMHRVVTNKTRTRMSFATILAPQADVEIEPLEHMLDTQQPNKMYKKVTYGDYILTALNKKHEGKEHVSSMKSSA